MQISDEMVEKAARVMARLDAGDRRNLAEVVDYVEGRWPRYTLEAKQILTAALAGCVVVPVEPTDAMLDAAMFAVPAHSSARDADKCMYIAMINASPPVSRGE